MPRYVVLAHDWPFPHFDLMLEHESTLRTWRLPRWPPAEHDPAERLPDHRLTYLDYEGPVSHGRGVVKRVASGHYCLRNDNQHSWEIHLLGHPTGVLTLPLTLPSGPLAWREHAPDAPH